MATVGAGFGGLFAAKALRRAEVDVTMIDRTNHHLFQPLLYQMATGILAEGDIAPPIRDVLRRQRNTKVLLGEVEAVDLDARRLTVSTLGLRSEVAYDSLILATGADQSYFGHPELEFATHPPGMKTIDHAKTYADHRKLGMTSNPLGMIRTPSQLIVHGRLLPDAD